MTNSKTFEKFVESKGMEYDSYDNLSAEKQEEIESEFREDKAFEYGEEIKEEKIRP